jgi:hypothetical protein
LSFDGAMFEDLWDGPDTKVGMGQNDAIYINRLGRSIGIRKALKVNSIDLWAFHVIG